jgi:hypothetical protein
MRNLVTTIFAASILCSSIIAKAEPSKLIRSFTLTPAIWSVRLTLTR